MMNTPNDTSHTAKRVALIASRGAGHADEHVDLVELLAAAGVRVVERMTSPSSMRAGPSARAGGARGCTRSVAAGGDGTLGTVATHLAGSGLPLGILPMGTSNDVARSLGVPLDLARGGARHRLGGGRRGGSGPGGARRHGQASWPPDHPGDTRGAPPPSARGCDAPGRVFSMRRRFGLNVEFARLATDIARRERWGALELCLAVVESLAHVEPIPVTLGLRDGAPAPPSSGAPARAEQAVDASTAALSRSPSSTRASSAAASTSRCPASTRRSPA